MTQDPFDIDEQQSLAGRGNAGVTNPTPESSEDEHREPDAPASPLGFHGNRGLPGQKPPAGRGLQSGRGFAGNQFAKTHGLTPKRSAGGSHAPDVAATLDLAASDELRAAVVSDLGGEAEVSAVMGALISDFAKVVAVRDACFQYIEKVGPVTRAGVPRAIVTLYLHASHRAERLAQQIGTTRRAAPVPSLAAFIETRAKAGKE